jgi:hypothetical protein
MIIKGKLKKIERSAIEFFADQLLTRQLKPHIMVHILLTNQIDNTGEIEVSDYNMSDIPRGFTIHLKRGMDQEETLRTIAHEMVHLKQYSRKELNESMTRWKGVAVNPDIIPYFDQPWEIEAHGLGDILYEQFMEKTYE